MTKKNTITTIFKRNLKSSELKNLLTDEGFNTQKINDISNLDIYKRKSGVLIVEIDSEKMLIDLIDMFKDTKNSWKVLCVVKKKIRVPKEILEFKILSQPIIFNEFLNIVKNLQKNLTQSEKYFDIGNLKYYPKEAKLVGIDKNRVIKLTELENKLIFYIIHNLEGATKHEILKKVWKHSTKLETHTLESLIYRLRRKIEIDPNNPKILLQQNKRYLFKRH